MLKIVVTKQPERASMAVRLDSLVMSVRKNVRQTATVPAVMSLPVCAYVVVRLYSTVQTVLGIAHKTVWEAVYKIQEIALILARSGYLETDAV